jgi:2-iminobutanoate/2-iminopropanoate deaminase
MTPPSSIERVPSSLGLPFSAAVRVGEIWELSGQIGLVAGTTELEPGGVGPETKVIMHNISELLDRIGSCMANIISVGVFLTDIDNFAAMNEVYQTFFDAEGYPARSAVGVTGLAFGAHVEIECRALALPASAEITTTHETKRPDD